MQKYKNFLIVLLICIVFSSIFIASFFLSYKTKYISIVRNECKVNNINNSLVMAVIKEESSFRSKVESSAGAKGLMQVMDSTALEVAIKINIEDFTTNDLFNEKINIKIGTYYLKELLNTFNGDFFTALAGYNAGPNRVKDWLKMNNYSKDGVVLFNTPFNETNNYIKKVLVSEKIYRNFFKINKEI